MFYIFTYIYTYVCVRICIMLTATLIGFQLPGGDLELGQLSRSFAARSWFGTPAYQTATGHVPWRPQRPPGFAGSLEVDQQVELYDGQAELHTDHSHGRLNVDKHVSFLVWVGAKAKVAILHEGLSPAAGKTCTWPYMSIYNMFIHVRMCIWMRMDIIISGKALEKWI